MESVVSNYGSMAATCGRQAELARLAGFMARRTPYLLVLSLAALLTGVHGAKGADVLRRELEPGALAIAKHGRNLGLEVHVPPGRLAEPFLHRFLANKGDSDTYKNRLSVFIPFEKLKPETQRKVLLAVYAEDVVDERGWTHRVVDERETLWSLCEWVTGRGTNYKRVMADPHNRLTSAVLKRGQRILIPAALLSDVMRTGAARAVIEPVMKSIAPRGLLEYGSDSEGEYALYRLAKGEALYTSVVARFTDFTENEDVLEACRIIAQRSGIANVRDIDAGQSIRIPTELLPDRYLPEGSKGRGEYEAAIREAALLRAEPVRSKDLSDVVVILDPGHGGQDPGARHVPAGLYEDEINYDIMCRIKALLETETGARVYVTVRDRSSGFAISDRTRFHHDKDEELTTTPPYKNDQDARISANLRWMLVNSIYQRELARGTDSRKIIFTSIHTDSIYDERLRGAMIYIPGAQRRRGEEVRTASVYAQYEEGRAFNRFSSNPAELRRDEALSRNFAVVLLRELGRKHVKRHDQGDAIRSQIRRGRNKVFVPAVLRNTMVPTKVLVETANLKNPTDQRRLADPWWREQFARAYVDALKIYFGAAPVTKTAKAN